MHSTSLRSIPLLLIGTLVLSGCLRTAVVSAGSAAVSATTSAASLAGSAVSTTASGAASLVGGSTSTSTGASVTAEEAVAATSATAVAGTGLSSPSAANSGPVLPPDQTIAQGAEICLRSAQYNAAILSNMGSYGWHFARAEVLNAEEPERARQISKFGVRGVILPDGTCSFRTTDLAFVQLSAQLREHISANFDGEIVLGSPDGRTGDCDGFTLRAPGINAWLYFTSANGGSCTKPGAGSAVTVKIL